MVLPCPASPHAATTLAGSALIVSQWLVVVTISAMFRHTMFTVPEGSSGGAAGGGAQRLLPRSSPPLPYLPPRRSLAGSPARPEAGFESTTSASLRPDRFCWWDRLRSAVTIRSIPAPSAAASSRPFDISSHPSSAAVLTSWPIRWCRRFAGTLWSNRTRKCVFLGGGGHTGCPTRCLVA